MLRTIAVALVFLSAVPPAAAEKPADVVVYGGTSGGVAAAVQAARMGRTVVLIEPGRHLGGLTSGGLGSTDIGNKQAIGGVAREFYRRIRRYYDRPDAWKRGDVRAVSSPGEDYASTPTRCGASSRTWPRPSFARCWPRPGVPVVFGERLDWKQGVRRRGHADHRDRDGVGPGVSGPDVHRRHLRGRPDGQGRRQLHRRPRGQRRVRRNAQRRADRNTPNRTSSRSRSIPTVTPGDPASGLLPGIHAGGPGEEGAGDRRVQAYNFRLCLTDVPENRVPFPKPADYDPLRYELLLRYIEAGWTDVFGNNAPMPNRKTDTNNHGAFSTDDIGMNYDYPDADYAPREKIVAEHRDYQLGLMWTLANNPRVPARSASRSTAGGWPRTSSPTAATGRTSSTSARPGGWWART